MELSVTFTHQPEAPVSLQLVKKLAEGKFSVFHVYSPAHDTSFALKVFPKSSFGHKQYLKEMIVADLSHTNIIQHIPIDCQHDKFHVILTELLERGDFFDIATNNVLSNNELLIRTYFHHLVAGVEYLHSRGVAHLDLKLENLMISNDFKLKIIDFDQAQSLKDEKLTSGGTMGYRAPEVMKGTCRNLAAVDLYAMGILLYILKANEYPFLEAKDSAQRGVWYYTKFTAQNRAFWSVKAFEKQEHNFFSSDFIELVNGLLESDVEKRFTMKDIKESKWFNGPILSHEALQITMEC